MAQRPRGGCARAARLLVLVLAAHTTQLACKTRSPSAASPPPRSRAGAGPAGASVRVWGAALLARARVEGAECPPALCLRMRGGITVKKLASLGDVKEMPQKMAEYLNKAIEGGLDEDRWTSDESALEELNEWMKQPDFWHVGEDTRKPLVVPAPFQSDLQAEEDNEAAERRGEIGAVCEEDALERASLAAQSHKLKNRLDALTLLNPEKSPNSNSTIQISN